MKGKFIHCDLSGKSISDLKLVISQLEIFHSADVSEFCNGHMPENHCPGIFISFSLHKQIVL